ncbi:Imm65 family immunity protein [Bacteroides acidifaciens]|uniref:Imm65 family immunity protein n=1 Tax=Bacteroides acidifaciens TaxID=85831 RepID=UPI00214A5FD3|nr:Imm65 family immunity protein [Bacteroides acidifaciens]MCR2005295.1 Imm65 family immunity protein [Bacteroides acidifaciens]
MRNIFFNLMFLFVMVGCTQPTLNKVQQMVEKQAGLLVDSGLIVNKYVILYELAINDSNHIYQIQASDCPAWGLDYPSKIVQYKDRYFCFIELDEFPMSTDVMIEQTGYSGNLNMEGGGGETWILVISKRGEKKKLIDISLLEPGWVTYFNIKELWPYFSGYVKGGKVQMGVISHDVELNDFSLHCNVDSLEQKLLWDEEREWTMIKEIYGEMYFKNNTDSTVSVSSETIRHYAVVNNHDSLYLSLCDSLPIILEPNEYKIINYKSLPHQECFFKNIALEKDSWGYLYNLFCNSTYCLLDVAGENMQKKIMFHDIGNYGFDVSNHRGIYLRILNHGIYDKKGTDTFRFRFWVDKWDITDDAEKERIWNESEKNFERNVERIRNRK